MQKWNQQSLKDIYEWYYGRWPTRSNPNWVALSQVLNQMMITTLKCSAATSKVQTILEVVASTPRLNVRAILKSVAKDYVKKWISGEQEIYHICKVKTAANFRSPVEIALSLR